MADQKINELPTKTAPSTGDKMLMIGTAEEYQIDYDQLATAILNKLSTQSFSSLDTTSKTVLGAIDELNSKSYLLSGGTAISSNSDMNNYTEIGNYYANSGIAQSLQNAPFNHSFTMKIDYGNGTGYICQTYREIDTGRIAIRYNNNQTANVEQWQQYVYFSDDATVLKSAVIYNVYESSVSFSDAFPGDQYIKNAMEQFADVASSTGNSSQNQMWINSGGPAYYVEIQKYNTANYMGRIYSYNYSNGIYHLYFNNNKYIVVWERMAR